MKNTILSAILIALAFVACKSSKESAYTPPPLDCSNKTLSYTIDIKPIMEANCTKCHNTNNKGGYNFLTIESVKKAAQLGELLGTVKHMKGFMKMPKMASKLDQSTIDKIECWINNGMME